MQKTILVTGATDGIGLETAKMLAAAGHTVLLHGRNAAKLADAAATLSALPGGGRVETYLADLSRMEDVEALATAVTEQHASIDVLINNPGSLLASKMVKEGFGVAGNDIRIGADILVRAALADEFAAASGQYFDNDAGRFASPHPDALDPRKAADIVRAIEDCLPPNAVPT